MLQEEERTVPYETRSSLVSVAVVPVPSAVVPEPRTERRGQCGVDRLWRYHWLMALPRSLCPSLAQELATPPPSGPFILSDHLAAPVDTS